MVSAIPHIAVIAPPTPGHLNPLQAVGAELVAIGWRVTIVHVEAVARFVADASIGFASLPARFADTQPLDAYLTKLAHPSGPMGFIRMIRGTADMTEALLRGAPDVLSQIGADAMVADAAEPAGPLIAQHLGIPYVVTMTGLPLLREEDVPPPYLGWRYRPTRMGRSRNRGGYAVSDRLMRPIARVLDDRRREWGLEQDRALPRLLVAQCPSALDYPRTNLPAEFRYGSPWRQASSADIALPEDGRPLVFCSLGTLQGSRRSLFATMARACAAIGARAVIGHGGGLTAAEEAALPGDPLVRAFWPQEAVLRRCDAAVLHGGFNSVLDALAAGVPIVVLPIAFEQPATAARLDWVGAGRVLSPRFLHVRALAKALDDVMKTSSYRTAARRIAADMAAGGGAPRAAAAISAALRAHP